MVTIEVSATLSLENLISAVEKLSTEELAEFAQRVLEIQAQRKALISNTYQYLVSRPETGYQQLYLKGHNMRVGQLIYKMRANDLNSVEAATDMDLPLAQVQEAQAYYQLHQTLIEQEAEMDKTRLQVQGVRLESKNLPG